MTGTRSTVPHSWGINTWPADVWPHGAKRARYLVRSNKSALLHAGALSRVGREIVVLGDRYARWLERHNCDVPGYRCAANRKRIEGQS